jgi:hypothetical protein
VSAPGGALGRADRPLSHFDERPQSLIHGVFGRKRFGYIGTQQDQICPRPVILQIFAANAGAKVLALVLLPHLFGFNLLHILKCFLNRKDSKGAKKDKKKGKNETIIEQESAEETEKVCGTGMLALLAPLAPVSKASSLSP